MHEDTVFPDCVRLFEGSKFSQVWYSRDKHLLSRRRKMFKVYSFKLPAITKAMQSAREVQVSYKQTTMHSVSRVHHPPLFPCLLQILSSRPQAKHPTPKRGACSLRCQTILSELLYAFQEILFCDRNLKAKLDTDDLIFKKLLTGKKKGL